MSEIILTDSQGNRLEELYQWDTHVVITVSGFPVSPVPTLQFAHPCSGAALSVIPTVDGGDLVATIPNVLLEEDEAIVVYFYVPITEGTETGYRTLEEVTINLVARPKPEGYSTTDIETLPLSVTANGEYYAPPQKAYNYVEVDVDPPYTFTQADAGKVVNSDGTKTAQTALAVGANGTYDTTTKNSVNVDVPNSYDASDVGKVLVDNGDYELAAQTDLVINANGVYTTVTNKQVEVNVPQGAISAADNGKVVVNGALVNQTTLNITANGVYSTTANNNVYVNVPRSAIPGIVKFVSDGVVLQTVEDISYGGSATYTGSTPTRQGYTFVGWLPEPVNIKGDITCEAQFVPSAGREIIDSWDVISTRSVAGNAQNYYSVGDYKKVAVVGRIGDIGINAIMNATIIDFNHDGNGTNVLGINFGLFDVGDDNNRTDVCIADNHYAGSATDGSLWFNMNHWGNYNWGGWKGSDLRYDILGSTNVAPQYYGETVESGRSGYDANSTCATSPVQNTLMSCLPSDLRAKMRPMKVYTNNKGGTTITSSNITSSVDYLPLLSAYEIFGSTGTGSSYEANRQTQYAYFANNAHRARVLNIDTARSGMYLTRTPSASSASVWVVGNEAGLVSADSVHTSQGLVPMFFV